MREFTQQFTEQISKGLRPASRQVNGYGLAAAYGIIPAESGFEPYSLDGENITGAVIGDTGLQIVDTRFGILSINNGTITDVETDTSHTIVDMQTAEEISISSARYAVFDEPAHTILSNGQHTLVRFKGSSSWLATDTLAFSGLCEYRGRCIIGGLYRNTSWGNLNSVFAQLQTYDTPFAAFPFDELNENWLMWSSVGQANLPFWLLPLAGHAATEELFLFTARINDFGWMPMPFKGKILAVHNLADRFIVVYGEDGIAVLQPGDLRDGDGSMPTLGLVQHIQIGVKTRSAVSVGPLMHVFVNSAGTLCALSSEGQFSSLGYEEFLVGDNITACYDEKEKQYVFSTDRSSFVFSEFGAGETFVTVKDIVLTKTGTVIRAIDAVSQMLFVRSTPIAFDARGQSRLTAVTLLGEFPPDTKVTVSARRDPNSTWYTRQDVPVNREGWARIDLTGQEFLILFTNNNATATRFDGFRASVQYQDKRYTRGVQVGSNTPGGSQ